MNLLGPDQARSQGPNEKAINGRTISEISLSPIIDIDFIKALVFEIQNLKREVSQLREDNHSLREDLKKAKIWTASIRIDDLFEAVDDIDRRLGPKEPQPLQKDRGDILRALLASNGPMLASVARKKMRLSKSQFSQLLASLGDYVELKPYHLDHRQKVLRLKNKKS